MDQIAGRLGVGVGGVRGGEVRVDDLLEHARPRRRTATVRIARERVDHLVVPAGEPDIAEHAAAIRDLVRRTRAAPEHAGIARRELVARGVVEGPVARASDSAMRACEPGQRGRLRELVDGAHASR